jgi:hypothetical protein
MMKDVERTLGILMVALLIGNFWFLGANWALDHCDRGGPEAKDGG